MYKIMDSDDETLRTELPEYTYDRTAGQKFSVIETCDASLVKYVIIHQEGYENYEKLDCSNSKLVTIPETISRLIAVETIKINACIKELPVGLSKLNNLKLLDLTGCYNLLSIPEEILKMNELKIKIGDVISRASEVLFIPVPLDGITPEVLSTIRTAKEKKIKQLIIRQQSSPRREVFALPDELTDFTELKIFSVIGDISSLPSWIGDMSALCLLTVSYSSLLKSLPESIGNLSNLTSLDLSGCRNLVSLPSSIVNLSNLTSLDLSDCNNLESLPESIGNLRKLTTLNLNSDRVMALRELPESIGNLCNLTSLDLNGCCNLVSLPLN